MRFRLTVSRFAIGLTLLGGVACAQEEKEAEPKEEKATTEKEDKKDPNDKPTIPKNAAVDAIVWGAVVYATGDGKKTNPGAKAPPEIPDLNKRLGKIKGFEAYKNFEIIGQHTQKVFSEYTNWLVPSKELFLNIDSKGPTEGGGGTNLHVQLWRSTKVLVKTDTTLKKGSPLIIGGPNWRDGRLIFVLILK